MSLNGKITPALTSVNGWGFFENKEYNVNIIAYCVMHNHTHILIKKGYLF